MKRDSKQQRLIRLFEQLQGLGFTYDEADALRRMQMTLSRWSEHKCNGNIQREGDQGHGKPRWHSISGNDSKGRRIADRERGALNRIEKIVTARNSRLPNSITPDGSEVRFYQQGDPRGCALYIVRASDVPRSLDGLTPDWDKIDSYYSRGIACCI